MNRCVLGWKADCGGSAAAICNQTQDAIDEFCSVHPPVGSRVIDTALRDHLLDITHNFMADGAPAEQKAAAMLYDGGSGLLKHMKLRGREKSHSARGCVKRAFTSVDMLKQLWEQHLTGGDSTLSKINHASSLNAMWRQELTEIESEVHSKICNTGSAAQRFESTFVPACMFVVTLGAILRLLCRLSSMKNHMYSKWARRKLVSITPELVILSGLAADIGDDCDAWVRFHDHELFDVTELVSSLREFMLTMHTMIIKKHALKAENSYLSKAVAFIQQRHVFVYDADGLEHVLHANDVSPLLNLAMSKFSEWYTSLRIEVSSEFPDFEIIQALSSLQLNTLTYDDADYTF